ncbi:hypothetical protein [Paraburkholderia terricola]|uniref:hypothetical protein n=1 Tax=Paraburkholderia terricola TaxID=169427 RepID=UPI001FD46C46|nr:hypothetical protein [Paraburkholderia terricola]
MKAFDAFQTSPTLRESPTMRAIRFFRGSTAEASSTRDASTPQSPQTGGRKGLSFHFSLPGLTGRGAKLSASAAKSSMPPRGVLKRKPLPENALGKLMHAEQPTKLTTEFLRREEQTHAPKSVTFAAKARVVDGAGKLRRVDSKRLDTHKMVEERSPELTRSNTARRQSAQHVAQNLSELIESHPEGTFDATIQQDLLPHEALEGADLDHLDHADVVHELGELQRRQNQGLLRQIALSLKTLAATSADEVREILPAIVRNTHVHEAHDHEADGITEEKASPEETIRAAFARLPERLRGEDVIEMFESLDAPHPRQVMAAQAQTYLDTIDERLAELNAKGVQR